MKILDYVEEKRNIALEEIAEGKSVVEKEIVIYAKITDLSILSKADSVEEQEQWEIKLPKTEDTASSGRMRVRKIIKEGTTQYVYTTKTEVTGGNLETSLEATEDTFKQFKLLASSGMVKTRYTYAIRGSELVWEVDVPILTGDNKTDWCKIDLEYKVYPTTIPEIVAEDAVVLAVINDFGDAVEERLVRFSRQAENQFGIRPDAVFGEAAV